MKVKLVVGELRELQKYHNGKRSRNGFYSFMVALKWRIDDDTGELELDDEDFAKIRLYSRTGYKRRLLKVFERTLGSDFDVSHTGWLGSAAGR
jgi:hypothetical protein